MGTVHHDRLCDHLLAQAELLGSHVTAADLDLPVPTCPGWAVRNLVRHVGGGHMWAEETVRTRASGPVSDDPVREVFGLPGEPGSTGGPDEGAALAAWLAAGAARLVATLREAGPDAAVWTPVPGVQRSGFYARRFAHETAVHRADAALALGVGFDLDDELAVDGVDEWMELESLPGMLEARPDKRDLPGTGRVLAFRAAGPGGEALADWRVDLTGTAISCSRGRGPAAVTVVGPPSELLLVLMRRRSPQAGTVDVQGDADLLGFWLERVAWT
ncbi:maleylpyruvate isomerase N-terminal domain-containing protein [Streptomonospora litoralis]|uniref:Mycothiol-dependent maleylpyruvate isomerase metal-binding domain-containing protein n=1 Tax=Streptomonospora litoralis TaxID=2498135 RepID=A0A4P6Q500_9ACTN|nr:maleylpyruvate isomerase N-terminal domain-containing protein [Streptomonospora litoralis]QBI53934.1 hypothetical protein EKD16_10740 [Streptomonospora litoralis]